MTDSTESDDPKDPGAQPTEPSEEELLSRRASRPKWSVSRLAKHRLGAKKRSK